MGQRPGCRRSFATFSPGLGGLLGRCRHRSSCRCPKGSQKVLKHGIWGLYIRNRDDGFGQIPSIRYLILSFVLGWWTFDCPASAGARFARNHIFGYLEPQGWKGGYLGLTCYATSRWLRADLGLPETRHAEQMSAAKKLSDAAVLPHFDAWGSWVYLDPRVRKMTIF